MVVVVVWFGSTSTSSGIWIYDRSCGRLSHFCFAKKYIPDVFCFGKTILELKAVGALADEHRRQILNYLRMTKCKLGLLINFGSYPRVDIERYAL